MDIKGTMLIEKEKVLINDKHYYLELIKKQFDSQDFWTQLDFHNLEFSRVIRYHTHRRAHVEARYLMRKGTIYVEESNDGNFILTYFVKANYLIYFSIFVGLILTFLGHYFTSNPISVGIISTLLILTYGFFGIRFYLKRLIKNAFNISSNTA